MPNVMVKLIVDVYIVFQHCLLLIFFFSHNFCFSSQPFRQQGLLHPRGDGGAECQALQTWRRGLSVDWTILLLRDCERYMDVGLHDVEKRGDVVVFDCLLEFIPRLCCVY